MDLLEVRLGLECNAAAIAVKRATYERATKILKNAGAKEICKTPDLAAHPGGTVKVGDLVDKNLMTEYDNLFVCNCSVIHEAWGIPPTTTIIGLGKRLGKYLLEEIK